MYYDDFVLNFDKIMSHNVLYTNILIFTIIFI